MTMWGNDRRMKFVGVSVVRSFYVQNIHSSYLVLQDNMFCFLISLSVGCKDSSKELYD
jgi:hypothetical protein